MPQQLDYVYEEETVKALHIRALAIYHDVDGEVEIPEAIKPGVYNSILNMVGQVKVSPLTIPPRMDIPRGQG